MSFNIRDWWGTWSNAFARLKNTAPISFPSSSCCNQSCIVVINADKADLFGWKPHTTDSYVRHHTKSSKHVMRSSLPHILTVQGFVGYSRKLSMVRNSCISRFYRWIIAHAHVLQEPNSSWFTRIDLPFPCTLQFSTLITDLCLDTILQQINF